MYPDSETIAAPQVQRRPWRKTIKRGILVVIGLWLVVVLCLMAAIHLYGQTHHEQPADVIVVLGAGLQRDNMPGPALTRRSNRAADLWQQGLAQTIICTGGLTGRATRSEADACKELLVERGVPAEMIILEDSSRSTEENAIYTHEIMRAHGWRTAVLVSDSFHVLRATWIFSQEGISTYTSPVSSGQMAFIEYVVQLSREVAALHWQVFKQLLNLPQTYVAGL